MGSIFYFSVLFQNTITHFLDQPQANCSNQAVYYCVSLMAAICIPVRKVLLTDQSLLKWGIRGLTLDWIKVKPSPGFFHLLGNENVFPNNKSQTWFYKLKDKKEMKCRRIEEHVQNTHLLVFIFNYTIIVALFILLNHYI